MVLLHNYAFVDMVRNWMCGQLVSSVTSFSLGQCHLEGETFLIIVHA